MRACFNRSQECEEAPAAAVIFGISGRRPGNRAAFVTRCNRHCDHHPGGVLSCRTKSRRWTIDLRFHSTCRRRAAFDRLSDANCGDHCGARHRSGGALGFSCFSSAVVRHKSDHHFFSSDVDRDRASRGWSFFRRRPSVRPSRDHYSAVAKLVVSGQWCGRSGPFKGYAASIH
jgi:hypothetical protein